MCHEMGRARRTVVCLLLLVGRALVAAPTNTSATTAIDVGAVPVSYTQNVHDAGTTYTVWVSFTPTISNVYSVFPFGALAAYRPLVHLYDGPASAPVSVVTGSANKPIQYWLDAGTTYWLECVRNSAVITPAVLTLSILAANREPAQRGDIFVNDDSAGLPLAILSATTDYTVQRFVQPFPNGENGDTLANGVILVWDAAEEEIVSFSRNFTETSRTALEDVPDFGLRANRTMNRFYVITVGNPNSTLYVFDEHGLATGTPYTITGITDLNGISVSNDEGILYWATNTINASTVRRWNLDTGMAGTDLAASIGNNYFCTDILTLEDDTILVMYALLNDVTLVKRYADDGTLLNTYTLPINTTTPPRLAYALDSPDAFWAWTHSTTTPGQELFQHIQVSDGTVLSSVVHMEFGSATYDGTETADPLARFGSSFSCPFLILTKDEQTTTTSPIRRVRQWQLPSSPNNKRMTMPYLELLMETGHGVIEGQGSDPQVMLEISKDGGKTWLPEQWRSAGAQGAWNTRVRWMRTPNQYRNAVARIVVTDPINWQFIAMLGDPEEGSS